MKSSSARTLAQSGTRGSMEGEVLAAKNAKIAKAGWKKVRLGDACVFQRGFDLPQSQMICGDYPVMGSNGVIGWHNEFTTEAPSVTIGRSGSVGIPHFIKGRSWSHNTVLFVKDFKGNNPLFIYYLLFTLRLGEYGSGSAVPTLNRNIILYMTYLSSFLLSPLSGR